jgi:conjugation system TraG family ATPase
MRNVLKAATLESKFPLLSVENDCIISKDADVTVAFRVELPELFTVTSSEYEAIHANWVKAVRVLPNYCIVHKQDWFIKENYTPEIQKEDLSFLSRSFERHFNERPYLNHACFLFLTKTTKERIRMQSNFNTLCRGFLVPKEIRDRGTDAQLSNFYFQIIMLVYFKKLEYYINTQKNCQNTNHYQKPLFNTNLTIFYYSQCYPTPTTKECRNNKNKNAVVIDFF